MSDTRAGSKLNLAINGFGRIGRGFLRAALEDMEFLQLFNIVAINDTADAKTLVHVFKYDSTFGKFEGRVIASNHSIQVDGIDIRVLQDRDPSALRLKEMRIDLVLESTGKFKETKEAQKHIQAGARKVIISAPAKGPDATLLVGINDGMALRVPVTNGSIAEMVMTLKKDVTIDEVNIALKEASEEELKGVMPYTNEPLVSSDIIGEPYSSIVDGLSTMVIGYRSRNVKVLSWYDNERSFACRLVDLIKFIGSKI